MNLQALASLLPGVPAPQKAYFRMVAAAHAAEMDETAHTVLYSWRYNPRGEFGALYFSASPECAWREKLKQVHGRPQDLSPQAVGTFEVGLSRCLDLTAAKTLSALGLERERLILPDDFRETQELSRQARRLGFEALHAPSAVGADCVTLAVFKDKLAPPSYCLLKPGSVRPYP